MFIAFSQPILYFVLDYFGLVFDVLPGSLAVVAVVLIGIESQNSDDQDCRDYYN